MADHTGPVTLVVEPDEKTRAKLTAALAQRGHRVIAHAGAASVAKPFHGDIILFAASASDGDLVQTLARLRGLGPRTARMVVCLLAERRQLSDPGHVLPDCVDQVLVKPLSGAVLRAHLETVERLARLRQPRPSVLAGRGASIISAHQPGRARLVGSVERALAAQSSVDGHRFAVIHVDMDHFRGINFTFGYDLADHLLTAVSTRLREVVARFQPPLDGDTHVAYLGGDEFAIFATPLSQPREAADIARAVQEALTAPFRVGDHDLLITASLGVAMGDPGYQRAEELLRDADTAMERAKSLGGAGYVFFSPAMRDSVVATLRLEADLRRALQNEELSLVYQPIVAVDSGVLVGFEALARWRDDNGTAVEPADFIPVAEQTGLIFPLDRWVLRQVCRQIRTWMTRDRLPVVPVAVNVSGVQFLRPDFVNDVDRTLRTHGLYGDALRFEITESAFISRTAEVAAMLRQLRALRLSLSIDDFGTGYSSLAYLQRIEADTLKIDRSFIGRMTQNGGDLEIVRAIVRLAQSLNKRVVAEGVETRSQLDLLRELECHFAQGVYFHPPLSAAEATQLLAAQRSAARHRQ
ncbi:MAG: bifunctional diguanylate cyclase/phosphodiesterase [Acidobacteriota bacterium]|jgi:diguanylate cyclase (GGDEF)-like protein